MKTANVARVAAVPPRLNCTRRDKHAFNAFSLSAGCVSGAHIGVAMTEGLASAFRRGIPTAPDFLPICVIAIAVSTTWRWLRFRSTGVSALGPLTNFVSGTFAVCLTYQIMTQLDALNLVIPLLPRLLLPIFLLLCIVVVEVESILRAVFDCREKTSDTLTARVTT